MSTARTPKCRDPRCTRRTLNPSGLCWQHLPAEGSPTGPGGRLEGLSVPASAASIAPPVDAAPEQLFADARAAFPDMAPELHPWSVHRQAELALSAAVSIEAYRRFPELDVPDAAAREEYLRQLRHELVETLNLIPVSLTDAQARAWARSSEDRFGRGLRESAMLAAYGFRKAWELGRLQGGEDPHGISYRLSYEEYCARLAPITDRLVSEEYDLQRGRYGDVIRELSGREPLAPVEPGGSAPDPRGAPSAYHPRRPQAAPGDTAVLEPPASRTAPAPEPEGGRYADPVGEGLSWIGAKGGELWRRWRANAPVRAEYRRQRAAREADARRQWEQDEFFRVGLQNARAEQRRRRGGSWL